LRYLCTPTQMRAIDRRVIESFGISGFTLMERAGAAVARAAAAMLGTPAEKRIVVCCGKGNNGGDGFVAARHLKKQNANVRCLLFADRVAVSGDAARHLAAMEQIGVSAESIPQNVVLPSIEADLVVDALLGTGLNGPPRGAVATAIHAINTCAAPVLSVDTPSGLTSDTGFPNPAERAGWTCVKADRTVTIALIKTDLAVYPGKAWCGKVDVADIGFPPEAVAAEKLWMTLPEATDMKALLPMRGPVFHKGDCGRAAVVAGSVGMTGAATLTALAAMRSGIGMTLVCLPASLADIMAVKLTEVMIRPLPETSSRTLSLAALEDIAGLHTWADALAIGPGLSRHPETAALIRHVTTHATLPIVLDADGLNAFAGHPDLWATCQAPIAITPHEGELSRLMDLSISEIASDRVSAARRAAKRFNVVVALKGAGTVVASPTGETSINPTGNAGMATAGSGDVLTGIITAFSAGGLKMWDAVRLGVYLHGLSGDIAAARLGMRSLIAGDLIDVLPQAFMQLETA